ncbi:MAG: hypothetical protein KGJ13_11250, partial [Patescibacteria group bacterium]|nr:hypothetical protein [Patescibacteria group bacterium]
MPGKTKKNALASLFPPHTPKAEQAHINRQLNRLTFSERTNAKAILAKYYKGKTTGAQETKLRSLGLLPGGQAIDTGRELAKNWVDLATRLTKRFTGRIICDISPQQINKWKRGDLVEQGVPMPPRVNGHGIDVGEWAFWFEKNIMSLPGWTANGNPAETTLAARARDARNQQDIDNAAITRMNRLVEEGKYRPMEEFIKFCDRLKIVFETSILHAVEHQTSDRMKILLGKLSLDPERQRIAEA